MQPIKAVHPRPPTAPPSLNGPNGPSRIKPRPLDADSLGSADVPMSVSALVTRRWTPVALSEDVNHEADDLEQFALGTPRNSGRKSSNTMSLMLPRSSRSIRHSVMAARDAGATRQSMVPDSAPVLSLVAKATPSTPARRSIPVAPLGAEVVNATSSWQCGTTGLTTPMNVDRRDLNGSLQLNAPLWRGSAVSQLDVQQVQTRPDAFSPSSRSAQVMIPTSPCGIGRLQTMVPSSPAGVVTAQVVMPSSPFAMQGVREEAELQSSRSWVPIPSTPARRASPVPPLGAEVVSSATPYQSTAVGLTTPMNVDRRDLNSSLKLNDPLWRGSATSIAYPGRGAA